MGGTVALAAGARRRWIVAALVVAAPFSGWTASARVQSTLSADIPEGRVELLGQVADEPSKLDGGYGFVLDPEFDGSDGEWRSTDLPPIFVVVEDAAGAPTTGDVVVVRGRLRSAPARVRGDPVAGRLVGASVAHVGATSNPVFRLGNALRARVGSQLRSRTGAPAAELLRGFLIGDTSGLAAADTEDLRRAGLSHFVAVSGSNVALFLAGWWLVTAPLASRPRARAGIGLVGLAVFVVATRWEPSVVRAAVMAGIILGGRLVGYPIDTWTALGAAVTSLLLVSGDLALSVGFQLSVAATAGVLAGAGVFAGRRPVWAWAALAATIAAQAAVTPLLLFHFGSVPLLSPVANLLALPMVTLATIAGGIGVAAGLPGLISLGLWSAGGVLWVAQTAGGWPQLDVIGVLAVMALGTMAMYRPFRPVLAVAVAAAGLRLLGAPPPPETPTVTFLDVGQGDATVLQDQLGAVVLVDGGRDPAALHAGLRRLGVRRINLLVVTHGDADHTAGLAGLFERVTVDRVWIPEQPELGELMLDLLDSAEEVGVPVARLRSGVTRRLGAFTIEVVGPGRRFQSVNDGSLVSWSERRSGPCCSRETLRRWRSGSFLRYCRM